MALVQDCQLHNGINAAILLLIIFGCLFPDCVSQKTFFYLRSFFKAQAITRARANTHATPSIVVLGERNIDLANQALAE